MLYLIFTIGSTIPFYAYGLMKRNDESAVLTCGGSIMSGIGLGSEYEGEWYTVMFKYGSCELIAWFYFYSWCLAFFFFPLNCLALYIYWDVR